MLCLELGRLAAAPADTSGPHTPSPRVFARRRRRREDYIELDTLADARAVADVDRRHRPVRREDAVAQYHTFISRR